MLCCWGPDRYIGTPVVGTVCHKNEECNMHLSEQRKRKIRTSIVFLLPILAVYTLFVIYPIFFTGYLSFTKWNGIGEKAFVGFANFADLFANKDFLLILTNTLKITVLSMLFQIPLGLVIAFLLYRTKIGFMLYRAVYFVPAVISSIAIGTMFRLLLNNEIGVIKTILNTLGLGFLSRPWLSDQNIVLYVVIFVQIWQFIGIYIVMFLAAFQSIDKQIFDSAYIDGANSVQAFLKIALPQIKPIIIVAIILCFTGSMKSFDLPFVMTSGGPGYASSFLGNYMHKLVFVGSKFGPGSAVTMIILFISLVFTLVFYGLSRKKD